MKYVVRGINSDLCPSCPARKGTVLTARLRGSSYRGRKIEATDEPKVDHCIIFLGNVTVADVMIANQSGNKSSAEHDADFIHSVFEQAIEGCVKPTTELTINGSDTFCTPVNEAINKFVQINYKEQ